MATLPVPRTTLSFYLPPPRRFRYNLTLFPSSRLSVPVLRRVCKRGGIKLKSRRYEFEGKSCKFGDNYPISAADVVEVCPMLKDGAAFGAGFLASPVGHGGSAGISASNPFMEVYLKDARDKFVEAKHHYAQVFQRNNEAYIRHALECADTAQNMYAQVVGGNHNKIGECFDMITQLMKKVSESGGAKGGESGARIALGQCLMYQAKHLALRCQLRGFDDHQVRKSHEILAKIFEEEGNVDYGIMHRIAALDILYMCAGNRHPAIADNKHRISVAYASLEEERFNGLSLDLAMESSNCDACNLFVKIEYVRHLAKMCSVMSDYKSSVMYSKLAGDNLERFLRSDHPEVIRSRQCSKGYFRMQVEKNVEIARGEGGGGKKKAKKKKKKH